MPVASIVQLLEALAMFAPDLPALDEAVMTAVKLLQTGAAPTAAEQASIDAGLDAANAALQKS
jgi:hypothetical protein